MYKALKQTKTIFLDLFCVVLFQLQEPLKWLDEKNVSEMTYFCVTWDVQPLLSQLHAYAGLRWLWWRMSGEFGQITRSLSAHVQDYDEPILKHLTDVRVKTSLKEPVVSIESNIC